MLSEVKHPTLTFRACSEGSGDVFPALAPIFDATGSKDPLLSSHVLIDFHMIAALSMRKKRHGYLQASVRIVLLFHYDLVLQITAP